MWPVRNVVLVCIFLSLFCHYLQLFLLHSSRKVWRRKKAETRGNSTTLPMMEFCIGTFHSFLLFREYVLVVALLRHWLLHLTPAHTKHRRNIFHKSSTHDGQFRRGWTWKYDPSSATFFSSMTRITIVFLRLLPFSDSNMKDSVGILNFCFSSTPLHLTFSFAKQKNTTRWTYEIWFSFISFE